VKFLFQKGAHILAKTREDGKSVLHLAADLEMVKLLVEQGADIQPRDYRGDVMPLHDVAG